MPDGSVTPPTCWINPRALPRDSKRLQQQFWADHRRDPTLTEPNERQIDGLTICREALPCPYGAGIEHTISEFTLRACGLYRDSGGGELDASDREQVTTHNPRKRAASKEQRRKRRRTRLARDGKAPRLDPAGFPSEHRWAVRRVN